MPNGDSPPPSPRRLSPAQHLLIALGGVSLFLTIIIGLLTAWLVTRQGAETKPGIEEKASVPFTTAMAGALDETFHRTGRSGEFRDVLLQPDGKILFSGLFNDVDGARHRSIARFNTDGTLDAGFAAQANGAVHAVAVQPDGKVVLAGDFGAVNGVSSRIVARVTADGLTDETFISGRGGDKEARSLAVQPDGKILVGGNFVRFNGESHQRIVRLHENGVVDSSFSPSLNQAAWRIVVQRDGRILVRGYFTRVNGTSRSGLARLMSDGALDHSFAPQQRLEGTAIMAMQDDGKILVAERSGPVIRLNTDGSVDDTFTSKALTQGTISALAVDGRGRVIVAGNFSMFDDFVTRNLARLNSDGSVDKSFQCSHAFDRNVSRVLVMANDDVIAAGSFVERLLRFSGGGERQATN